MKELQEQKVKEDKKRDEKIKIAQGTIADNKIQQKEQRLHEKKEKEEAIRIEQWNLERERKHEEFKEKILNKRKEAQVIRQKMIDKQVEYLSQMQNTEVKRFENQVKEKEEEAISRYKSDQAKKQEMKECFNKYNTKMIDFKQNRKDEIRETDIMQAKQIKIINAEIAELEKEEEEEEKARNKQLQKQLVKQVEYKNALKMREVEEERNVFLNQQELLRREDDDFKSQAEQYLQQGSVQGLNTKTLLLKLKKINDKN